MATYAESTVLIVRSAVEESKNIARMLGEQYRVLEAGSPEDALTHVSNGVDLVISGLDASDFDGLDLIRLWKTRRPQTPFLVITDGADVNAAVEAMKLGASDCLV
ncbi:MAG: response regulator, partial [Phycisphaerales bacterium]|nr:response regulator [Phycisphaerales bacterium]